MANFAQFILVATLVSSIQYEGVIWIFAALSMVALILAHTVKLEYDWTKKVIQHSQESRKKILSKYFTNKKKVVGRYNELVKKINTFVRKLNVLAKKK